MVNILLHQHRYDLVRNLLELTTTQKDLYSEMIRTYAGAFLDEKESGEEIRARSGYMETIELAETFGPIADIYGAMGYMGLSRLHEKEGLQDEAENYKRKASRLTSYDFILDE